MSPKLVWGYLKAKWKDPSNKWAMTIKKEAVSKVSINEEGFPKGRLLFFVIIPRYCYFGL